MKRLTNLMCIILLLTATRCGIPKDPRNSYKEAQSSKLKVGVVNNPPYSYYDGKDAKGTEVMLIEEFGKEKNLEIEYLSGSESELVEKLEKTEISVLIGGFKKKTLWEEKAGLTSPYDKNDHVFLIPKGENRLAFELESFFK